MIQPVRMTALIGAMAALCLLTACTGPTPPTPFPPRAANTTPTASTAPPEQLITDISSGQQNYPQSHKYYYTRLMAYDLRTDTDPTKCVDSSFLTWIVRAFNKSAANVSITAQITDPLADPVTTVPIYSTSKDGATNACSTNSLGTADSGHPITPYYPASKGADYKITLTLNESQTTNVSAAKAVQQIATTMLTYTGANGALIKTLGESTITTATSAIDATLSANYSFTNSIPRSIDISPAPAVTPADWDKRTDGIEFASPTVEATVWGPSIGDGVKPNFKIVPQYVTSLLTDAQGGPLPVTEILGEKLLPPGSGTLRDKLLAGINGVSTASSKTITDPNQLDAFCQNSLNVFQSFLTYDDALVAQYANLYENTAYLTSPTLRAASTPHCLPADQQAELLTISPNYQLPSVTRATSDARNAVVDSRTTAIAHALLNGGDAAGFSNIVSAPATFMITVAPDVAANFPAPSGGAALTTLAGQPAVAELGNLGVVAMACGRAPPAGSVRTLSAVVVTSKGKGPIAAIMTFANADPTTGAATDASAPVLLELQFYSLTFVEATQGVDFKSCDLVS